MTWIWNVLAYIYLQIILTGIQVTVFNTPDWSWETSKRMTACKQKSCVTEGVAR